MPLQLILLFLLLQSLQLSFGSKSMTEQFDMNFGSVEVKMIAKRLTRAECFNLTSSVHHAVEFFLTHMDNQTDWVDLVNLFNSTTSSNEKNSYRLVIGYKLDEEKIVNKSSKGQFIVSCESLVDFWSAGLSDQRILIALSKPGVDRTDLAHKLQRRFGRRLKRHLTGAINDIKQEGKKAKQELSSRYKRAAEPINVEVEQRRMVGLSHHHFRPNAEDRYPTWGEVLSLRDYRGQLKVGLIFWISAYTTVFLLIITCHCFTLCSCSHYKY